MALRETDPAEVGGYRIEDRLGSGGMGVVYLARSASGRRLAVKVVHAHYADDDEFRIRFRREVATARQVSGAFTAPVVDADADAPRPWMATLYIAGEDLGTHVRRHGPLPPPKVRELAAGLAEALGDIHRAGMVHRDLKPANVMLAEDGPRVIDFGISRAAEFAPADVLTQTGRVMGTPPFMSPEQFSSPHDVGPAADIFSLGSVVAYAATGRGPFDSPTPYETAVRVVDGDPELYGVPDELLPFVRLCLEKSPKARPAAGELLTLLRDGRLPAPRPAPEPAGTPPQPRRRRRARLLLASALGALLLAVATTVTVVAINAEPRPVERDLPAGWRAWAEKAKGPEGADGPFKRCAAVDSSLVCAGDGLMAARFTLAEGRNTWSRPLDPTPDGGTFSGDGALITTRGDVVYTYGSDEQDNGDEHMTTVYTVQALDADTGKVLWKAVTGDGAGSSAPDATTGWATAVPGGILTIHGDEGDAFALLDADDGKVRWRYELPAGSDPTSCSVHGPAGVAYVVCQSDLGAESTARTRVVQLDPATGRARWTASAKGSLGILGQRDGRLVLADRYYARRTLTLIHVSSHVVTTVKLSRTQPENATLHLARGTLYSVLPSGTVRAIAPRTGQQLWETNSTLELPGPPAVTAHRVYLASPSGRLAALNTRTGKIEATRPGRDDGGTDGLITPAAPVLAGDALYVSYGVRSVYSVDVRSL
ncbi:protein kinase domain-containing protein [Streptomyces sp. NPDC001920]